MFSHEIHKDAYARWQMLPAEIANVMASVCSDMLRQRHDKFVASDVVPDLVGRHLSNAVTIEDSF